MPSTLLIKGQRDRGTLYGVYDFLEKYIGVNLSGVSVVTACFNGVNDGTIPPCDNVDLYIKLSNGVKVFVYGRETQDLKQLNKDKFVIRLNKL